MIGSLVESTRKSKSRTEVGTATATATAAVGQVRVTPPPPHRDSRGVTGAIWQISSFSFHFIVF